MFDNEKKDYLIQLRVNKQQKETIKYLADKENKTVTKYIFSLLEKDFKKKVNKQLSFFYSHVITICNIYYRGDYMEIIVDFIWFCIDKLTDNIAEFIKLKELEHRLKL